ncbi:hypothetical protein [Legionella jamestowniensis]|uniref:Uncharacterized protein n=1 Tax=Legionella jamestowniensis TaxID=455 RepID=A0A0W0UTR8_9GAMM|nr:hypothetical protein [Legionella jamestowniensis]KTD11236.1 hypothetical protein Ljam_0430 [Legionella jamestowniensis]SFL70185.1 hypothetical protein SAMN02746073_1485 [Legionella jamestowniensis DSM 19215]
MKILKIKEYLDSYDANKGYGRSLKEEPHIAELRQFYLERVKKAGDELTPEELRQLVKICLGKKNWNGSESSNTFDALLKELGGRNALQRLKENKQLSVTNVGLLEKHKEYAENLSLLIEVLKGYRLDASLTEFAHELHLPQLHEKLKDIASLKEAKVLTKQTLLLTANSPAPCTMTKCILLLQEHGITGEAINCLSSSTLMSSTYTILTLLVSINPKLISPNLSAICKLGQHTLDFLDILKELAQAKEAVTQKHIEICVNPHLLNARERITSILILFREAGWNSEANLFRLLESVIKNEHLKIGLAVVTLPKNKLKPEQAQFILDALFNYPQFYNSLTNAVIILTQHELLTDENLAIIIREPQYADKIAEGINTLNAISLDNSDNKNAISKIPEHAASMASLFKQLVKAKQFSPVTRELALKQPHNAEIAAGILRLLRLEAIKLDDDGEKINFCEELFNKNLMTSEFSNLLSTLDYVDLLNATNIRKLINHSQLIRTIASACCCLDNNNQLKQDKFDLLFEHPNRALAVALALDGRLRPVLNEGSHQPLDNGGEDFLAIRRAAILLAQGSRGQAFFKPVKINMKQLQQLDKLTKIDLSVFDPEIQNHQQQELLIKIAQQCGNGYLEEDTAYHVAADVLTM